MILHWDGKILQDITGDDKVDRLAIVLSNDEIDQVVGVPKMDNGTGLCIATTIFEILRARGLLEQIEALIFDTTASNTGRFNGAAVLFEEMVERELLHLPCRHHIYEIILRSVFELKLKLKTTSPHVALFDSFKQGWNEIDKTNFKAGIEDAYIASFLKRPFKVYIKRYCEEEIQKGTIREDYRELLDLILIFIGDTPRDKVKFRKPGASHHARWMAKAIYVLKIFIFREQVQLTQFEEKALREICLFIVILYAPAWYKCVDSVHSPFHDLTFIKRSIKYAQIDKDISSIILKKMSNHLWYLSQEAVAFSFYDPAVPLDAKRRMVVSLKKDAVFVKHLILKPSDISQSFGEKEMNDFVNEHTMRFFERFNLSAEFLNHDPSTWEDRLDYQAGFKFCSKLNVVNDTAERAIKLMTDYNRILTKNEEEKQFLMDVVAEYRRSYPSYCKKNLL